MSSDKEILQLAMKSSGGIVESWNTVKPTFWDKIEIPYSEQFKTQISVTLSFSLECLVI